MGGDWGRVLDSPAIHCGKGTGGLAADALDQATCQAAVALTRGSAALEVDDLKFQRGTAAVENQHVHGDHPSGVMTSTL